MTTTGLSHSRAIPLYVHFVSALLAVCYLWYVANLREPVVAHQIMPALFGLAISIAVPGSAFVSLYLLGRNADGKTVPIVLQRLARFAFAAPPLFVALGLLMHFMKIAIADAKVWVGVAAMILCGGFLTFISDSQKIRGAPTRVAFGSVLVMLGVASGAIILVLLLPYLGDHLIALSGTERYNAAIFVFQHLYRVGVVEPVVIALFLVQILSGLVLTVWKIGARWSLQDALQTVSGVYLVMFVASHVSAVFVFTRYLDGGLEYSRALGVPEGLLANAWNGWLIPHYGIGILLVLLHIASGLRTVMLADEIHLRVANTICWAAIGAGTIWAALIIAGMAGLRL
ncbi:hypothetical protein SB861_36700 [Paraburkholderia sp. SIMBA_049]